MAIRSTVAQMIGYHTKTSEGYECGVKIKGLDSRSEAEACAVALTDILKEGFERHGVSIFKSNTTARLWGSMFGNMVLDADLPLSYMIVRYAILAIMLMGSLDLLIGLGQYIIGKF